VDAFIKEAPVVGILTEKDTKLQAAFREAATDPDEQTATQDSSVMDEFTKLAIN
jgi:hypothetical protein